MISYQSLLLSTYYRTYESAIVLNDIWYEKISVSQLLPNSSTNKMDQQSDHGRW